MLHTSIDVTEKACEYFNNGYSCSESVIKAFSDAGIVSEELVGVATSFSGGMSSGCLCGAVAGSQMVIGALHGKDKDNTARSLAKEFVERFKSEKKATCCKFLSIGYEFSSPERKQKCTEYVKFCVEILKELL